jgi:hypothetical protein
MTDPPDEHGSEPAELGATAHNILLSAKRLRQQCPDIMFRADVARILGVSPQAVHKYHDKHLAVRHVEGIATYDKRQVQAYARKRMRGNQSRIVLNGADVARLELICEAWYRQNLDTAEAHLLKLAKRIARL